MSGGRERSCAEAEEPLRSPDLFGRALARETLRGGRTGAEGGLVFLLGRAPAPADWLARRAP